MICYGEGEIKVSGLGSRKDGAIGEARRVNGRGPWPPLGKEQILGRCTGQPCDTEVVGHRSGTSQCELQIEKQRKLLRMRGMGRSGVIHTTDKPRDRQCPGLGLHDAR